MAAPTFVQEAETTFNSNTTPKTSAAITDLVGDVLVSCGVGEDGEITSVTPTLTGETFTARENLGTTGASSRVDARSAVIASAGTSETVSVARAGTAFGGAWFGANQLLFRGSDGVGAAESAQATGGGAPNLSITTLQANSAIVVIITDWGASDPTAWTWRTINGSTPTIQSTFRDSAHFSFAIGYYPDAGAIGAKSAGVTNSLTYTIAAVEVKGSAGGGGGNVTVVIPRGQATASGRAILVSVTVVSARAQATASGRSVAAAVTARIGRGGATAQGRAPTTSISNTAAIGRGQATAQGRNVTTTGDMTAVIGRGGATASGRQVLAAWTVVAGRGQATATGRTVAVVETALITRGQATASGRTVTVVSSSIASIGRGQATAQGRNVQVASGVVATVLRGQATASGRSITVRWDSTAVILRGQATANGRAPTSRWSSTAAVGRGQATARGRNVTAIETGPVVAVGSLEGGITAAGMEDSGSASVLEGAALATIIE